MRNTLRIKACSVPHQRHFIHTLGLLLNCQNMTHRRCFWLFFFFGKSIKTSVKAVTKMSHIHVYKKMYINIMHSINLLSSLTCTFRASMLFECCHLLWSKLFSPFIVSELPCPIWTHEESCHMFWQVSVMRALCFVALSLTVSPLESRGWVTCKQPCLGKMLKSLVGEEYCVALPTIWSPWDFALS